MKTISHHRSGKSYANDMKGKHKSKTSQDRPVLLVDDSDESSEAMTRLVSAGVLFALVPAEGPAPVLLSSRLTYRGIEGIERFIEETQTVGS